MKKEKQYPKINRGHIVFSGLRTDSQRKTLQARYRELEQARPRVIELWQSGKAMEEIAREVGLTIDAIKEILGE